jgi:predicted Zn finger-like uncharacterized protein|tara:strand:+ start:17 stop:538 length:522 start_codon:yes stop_codon:yes gene_type:complete
MILTCNSCRKKFVVPDNAITANGRTVQCGSCGNKWKQYPENKVKEMKPASGAQKIISKSQKNLQKKQKSKKVKKSATRKARDVNLYSPEYLAKKHGIKLSEDVKTTSINNNVSFGFYNSLILYLVIIIIMSRGLYFFQDFVTQKLPFTEFYIDYFFESIKNIFEIWKNLISSY